MARCSQKWITCMRARLYFISVMLVICNAQVLYASSSKVMHPLENLTKHHKGEPVVKDSATQHKVLVIPESDELFTTHATFFNGGSVIFEDPLSSTLYLGLGLEYSHCHFHGDNGWNLYNLNFWPVYIDSKWNFLKTGRMAFYADLSLGCSFDYYTKENPLTGNSSNIAERGLYFFSGIGYTVKIGKNIRPLIEIGFKGFHMSFNKYDVNPHGLTMRAGFLL